MSKATTGMFWWTIVGKREDKTAVLMKHDTEHDARWHYGVARALGGDFNYIAITKRAATGVDALANVEEAGWTVTQILGGYEGWKATVKVKGVAA